MGVGCWKSSQCRMQANTTSNKLLLLYADEKTTYDQAVRIYINAIDMHKQVLENTTTK